MAPGQVVLTLAVKGFGVRLTDACPRRHRARVEVR
jgi:hypothetical protein